MPVYLLTDELIFPPPEGASEEGVVAAGGDARPERLVLAYSQGIFPWPARDMPLLWFSPNPRYVLVPSRAHIGRSLRKRIRKDAFEVRMDTAFEQVVDRCATVERIGQDGTWITPELRDGFVQLHRLGYAHSCEAWREGKLVGGVYGLSLGAAFFGESMFALEPDASKVAFTTLLGQLDAWGTQLIDCQMRTQHLERFGAQAWLRSDFLRALRNALSVPTRRGPWTLELTPRQALQRLS